MKRAYCDITLELLTQLLQLKNDVMIVHVENRFEQGAVLRLHLRGDGLPEKTKVPEGWSAIQLEDLTEVRGLMLRPSKGSSVSKCCRCGDALNNIAPGLACLMGERIACPASNRLTFTTMPPLHGELIHAKGIA